MNIAFPALLFLLLLMPGLIFIRVARRQGEFAEFVPPPPQPFSAEIGIAIIFAAAIHCAACLLNTLPANVWQRWPHVNLDSVLMLMLGKFGDKEANFDWVVKSAAGHPLWIFLYFSITFGLAALLGWWLGRPYEELTRRLGLLSAQDFIVEEWRNFFWRDPNELVMVTAVVKMDAEDYLFLGILEKPIFDRATFALERLELREVQKRKLEDGEDQFEEVFGHRFILRYSEITTLNVIYAAQSDE